jgi:hypothetical protein
MIRNKRLLYIPGCINWYTLRTAWIIQNMRGQMLILFYFIFYNILYIYLLSAWSRFLLEKLTGSQLVKEFPHFMEPKFHYSINKCLPPVPILSPYQWINLGLRHWFISYNMIHFYGEELFAHHQNPKLDFHPLSGIHQCLFNIFKATLHIGVGSSICNLSTCNAVESCFQLSWLYCILWWIYYNKWFRRCIVSMYNKYHGFLLDMFHS